VVNLTRAYVRPVSSFAVDKDIKSVEQKVKQHVATVLPAARVIYGAGAAVGTNSADVDAAIAAILKVGSVALKQAGTVIVVDHGSAIFLVI